MHGDPKTWSRQRVTGDVRGNIEPGVLGIIGVFVMEHNRIAERILEENPNWSDEDIFQEARREIVGMIQHIAYEEVLPVVVGRRLKGYEGYEEGRGRKR